MKYFQQFWKKIDILLKSALSLLVLLGGIINAKSQDFEQQLKKSDSLWKANHLSEAIHAYQKIIDKGGIPVEYQALLYLRLAEAQFQAKKIFDCKQTIASLKLIPNIREHYRLKLAELENRINNIPIHNKTDLPKSLKIAGTFFVSGNANSNNVKNSFINSFRTIEDALQAIKVGHENSIFKEGTIEIVLLDPQYNLSHTVIIGNEYSGTEINPLVIRSFSPGKRTLITGGVNITKWENETDPFILSIVPQNAASHILVADFKENGIVGIDDLEFGGMGSLRESSRSIPQFFYNGMLQKMARWPNNDDTIISLQKFTDKRADNWTKESDIWLHGYWAYLWADAYEKFKSYAMDIISLEPPLNRYGFMLSKWHVLNSLAEMDMVGDWKISPEKGKIWFYPPTNFNPETCILSVFGPAFSINNCQYITLKDIDFRYIRSDAIKINRSDNTSIINCTIKDVSGLALVVNGGKNHLIHSCIIQDIGRGGMMIKSGDIEHLENSGSVIENCTIRNISIIDRTYTPGILLDGFAIKVQHCLFENIPSSAIRLEGNDMLIQLNEFSKCVFESDDQGAIDVYGNPLYRGNVIRWNYFHDIGAKGLHVAGIRLDDAISGFCINENIFRSSSSGLFGGVQIHGGQYNIVEGNLFIDEYAAVSQSAYGKESWLNAIKNEQPMSNNLKNKYWQNDVWQSRYPDLKNLYVNFDNNYFIDNIAINVKNMYLRKSDQVRLLDENRITDKNIPATVSGLNKYIVPWHLFPINDIGVYSIK